MLKRLLYISFMMCRLLGYAFQPNDTLPHTLSDTLQNYQLQEVIVSDYVSKATPNILSRGKVSWEMSSISLLPQFLGNADPMRYAHALAGVQANNDYDSGMHIYGCDNSHNMVSIEGVPIYNANHLLGLFSTFNPSHFSRFSIDKTATNATFPNRLGGNLQFESPHKIANSVSGELSLGFISSQGTLRLPAGKHSSFTISGRGSFINLLYGYALKYEESQLRYSFADVNFSWDWKPNNKDHISVDAYWGGDWSGLDEQRYLADLKLNWGNIMIATHWNHVFNETSRMKHSIYYTRYCNDFLLDYPSLKVIMNSSIQNYGYTGQWQGRSMRTGININIYKVVPQSPLVMKGYNQRNNEPQSPQVAQEYSPYADYSLSLSPDIVLTTGIRTTLFIDAMHATYFNINPSLSIMMSKSKWEAALTASTRHQYLFQTGFSSMGLPTEFWSLSDIKHKPQSVINVSGSFAISLSNYKIVFEGYYKTLKHIIEYNGSILDFVTIEYVLDNILLHGKGHNFGFSVSVSKHTGRLTGWISYSLGRAVRRFDSEEMPDNYPANHERIHELNVVASFNLNKRISLSGNMVIASGTPYTSINNLYLYAGQVISNYNSYNGSRLKPYFRLDLSATYKIKMNGKKEHGFNISVYNALATKNELFYSWKITKKNKLNYSPRSFLVSILPSVSYYFKF